MKFTHHAFLIPHSYASIRDALRAQLNADENTPEIVEMVEGTFSIDRVRELIDLALRKSEDRGQVFVVAFDSILHEAQNALLKVLEEPVPRTHFFLITPNPHKLLPTVTSRLGTSPFVFDVKDSPRATKFLSSEPSQRLLLIKKKIEEKDRQGTADLLKTIIQRLEQKRNVFPNNESWAQTMRQLQTLQGYSEDPASSVKMLLEHTALTLPVL